MSERKILNVYQASRVSPSSTDVGLQIIAEEEDNVIHVKAFDEWCGDTETGFGAEVSVDLDIGSAIKLRDFLNEWLVPPSLQIKKVNADG